MTPCSSFLVGCLVARHPKDLARIVANRNDDPGGIAGGPLRMMPGPTALLAGHWLARSSASDPGLDNNAVSLVQP